MGQVQRSQDYCIELKHVTTKLISGNLEFFYVSLSKKNSVSSKSITVVTPELIELLDSNPHFRTSIEATGAPITLGAVSFEENKAKNRLISLSFMPFNFYGKKTFEGRGLGAEINKAILGRFLCKYRNMLIVHRDPEPDRLKMLARLGIDFHEPITVVEEYRRLKRYLATKRLEVNAARVHRRAKFNKKQRLYRRRIK